MTTQYERDSTETSQEENNQERLQLLCIRVWLSVKKGHDKAINSLAITSNCFSEQLAKAVTKGKTYLDSAHSIYAREVAAEEYSTTRASMHSNATFW